MSVFPQSLLSYVVQETGQAVQMSIHRPSRFMVENWERVLPSWDLPTAWVIVVLQQARFFLTEPAPHVEKEKDRLREKFMRFGVEVAINLRDQGFLADLIDPRSGYPVFTRAGEIPHDDAAAVRALLDFPVITDKCSVIKHPDWDSAVYPGILLTSAATKYVQPVLEEASVNFGWVTTVPKADVSYIVS